jgi:tRNA pseudouridine55 synthase
MLNGILFVDKSRGMTSHDVVAAVRRMTGMQAVGHTGTLDPDASGMLILCLGRATKFARFFEELEKTYWTVMQLGVRTDTQDATGRVLSRWPVPALSRERLQNLLSQFTGPLQQIPPMYSAVKYQGQRLYHLARQSRTVPRVARSIVVHRLALVDTRDTFVTFTVLCSKGTYIRTLCEDIGLTLGCGAHMVHLQRCQIGPFQLRRASSLEVLQQSILQGSFERRLIPLTKALDFLPALSLTPQQYDTLKTGQGKELAAILRAIHSSHLQAPCYRLCAPPQGTFAIMHRRPSVPTEWKLRYLAISHPESSGWGDATDRARLSAGAKVRT